MITVEEVEDGRKRAPLFKRKIRHEIQAYDYARFYFGLNLEHQEGVIPKGIHSIPIPFMKRDRAFLRYKSFVYPHTWGGHKIRTDQMIKMLKDKMAFMQGSDNARLILQSQLDLLLYIDGDQHE